MSPVFMTEHLIDRGYAKIVGTNHLKLDLAHPQRPQEFFPSIAFNQGEHFGPIAAKIPFNVCYCIEEHEWNGNVSLQLNVKDIKFGE